MARSDETNGRWLGLRLLTGVEMCPITKGEMPQKWTPRRLPVLKAVAGLLGTLVLALFMGVLGMVAPPHATASHRVSSGDSSLFAVRFSACVEHTRAVEGSLVRSQLAEAPAAAVFSAPVKSQHPATPIETETPEPGEGSIEAGDDLSGIDDLAYHLRVVFDGTAQLNREVERGVSLGGRAISRLEDNRSDKPPRG